MNRDELKTVLTGRNISYANNASTEKLQALLDAELAKDAEKAEAAQRDQHETATRIAVGDGVTLPDSDPVGKPATGAVTDAGPAADASTAPAESNAIPELEIIAKMGAGLTREQAVEVITHQRAHDKSLGI